MEFKPAIKRFRISFIRPCLTFAVSWKFDCTLPRLRSAVAKGIFRIGGILRWRTIVPSSPPLASLLITFTNNQQFTTTTKDCQNTTVFFLIANKPYSRQYFFSSITNKAKSEHTLHFSAKKGRCILNSGCFIISGSYNASFHTNFSWCPNFISAESALYKPAHQPLYCTYILHFQNFPTLR